MIAPLIHWIDRMPLWKVFWIGGVLPSNLLWLAVVLLLSGGGHVVAVRALLLALLLYTALIVIAVWRSAPNVVDRRYGVLAKALTVVWAINTALLVFFLELQLLA